MDLAQKRGRKAKGWGRPKELNLFIDPKTIELKVESAMQFQEPEEGEKVSEGQGAVQEITRTPGTKRKKQSSGTPTERLFLNKKSPQCSNQRVTPSDSLCREISPQPSTPNSFLSSKSRELALKAEARFFSKHQLPSPKPQSAHSISLEIEVESQNLWQMNGSIGHRNDEKQVENEGVEDLQSFSNREELEFPSRGQPLEGGGSLLQSKIKEYLRSGTTEKKERQLGREKRRNLSADMQFYLARHQRLSGPTQVAQRSAAWNDTRKQKLATKKSTQERAELSECTFSPVIYTKIPRRMHLLPAESLLQFESSALRLSLASKFDLTDSLKAALTPKSTVSTASHTRVHSLGSAGAIAKSSGIARQLSPVRYTFGVDFDRLERVKK